MTRLTVQDVESELRGGDRRSLGNAEIWADRASKEATVFDLLVTLMQSRDPVVSMRAADAAEKSSRDHPEYLASHKKTIVSLLRSAPSQEVRWHAALMTPRLDLATSEARSLARVLRSRLDDRSVIVRVNALQALVEIADRDPSLRPGARRVVEEQSVTGPPAIRARCRKLLRAPMARWPSVASRRVPT